MFTGSGNETIVTVVFILTPHPSQSYRLTPSDPAAGSVTIECTLTSPVIGGGDKHQSSVIPSGDKDDKPFQRKIELAKTKTEPGMWVKRIRSGICLPLIYRARPSFSLHAPRKRV